MNQQASQPLPNSEPLWSAPACCPATSSLTAAGTPRLALQSPNPDPSAYVRRASDGTHTLALIVENADCPACIAEIEKPLLALPGITHARLNLTLKRLSVAWAGDIASASTIAAELGRIGYRAIPYDAAALQKIDDDLDQRLLKAMAVAGFAGANIMLLSISVWAGHAGSMEDSTRAFFHWLSALIAIPVVAYSGQPFFRSALRALTAGRVNMDVPISLGVLLAVSASVFETFRNAQHAYFDAAVMLLFFLLIGRYLDRRLRGRARNLAANVMAMNAVAATVIDNDGRRRAAPADELRIGMKVAIVAGDRIPADGRVSDGAADLDESLLTGESRPRSVGPGSEVLAGTLCLNGALTIAIRRDGQTSLLSDIAGLMDRATEAKTKYTQIADRWAKVYAPAVHLLAAGTFIGWVAFGAGWHPALMAAIAVLIITCPCALGLAVPAVQVVAVSRLLKSGVIVKSGDALERLAKADTIVLDKTGTLTEGQLALVHAADLRNEDIAVAARLAGSSKHPMARAIVRAADEHGIVQSPLQGQVSETPGCGLEVRDRGVRIRLGSRSWCGNENAERVADCSELWLDRDDGKPVRFLFRDRLRADAGDFIAWAHARGYEVELLSGDQAEAVTAAAETLGIASFRYAAKPQDKFARLEALARSGRKVMMIGDGINDAPALALAHVSMSPSSAADISQTAADFVFLGGKLMMIAEAIDVAVTAKRRMFENFALAIAYNIVAVPIAILGWVTPLIAAGAMSGSSLLVSLNALRMKRMPAK